MFIQEAHIATVYKVLTRELKSRGLIKSHASRSPTLTGGVRHANKHDVEVRQKQGKGERAVGLVGEYGPARTLEDRLHWS